VIAVEGEPLRPFTHTVITETPSGEWAIGGQSLTAEDVRAKRAAPARITTDDDEPGGPPTRPPGTRSP